MDVEALRDHARQMLEVITADLDRPQTQREQHAKASGKADANGRGPENAAQAHGAGRAESGFSISQMVAEFRALRASVIRLWTQHQPDAEATDLEDMIRFNEAIDQAIAESITRFSTDIAQSKERFLAILAHDLQTPLGAIITASGFMLDTGDLEEPHRTLATRVLNSGKRMHRMVKDLLDFTRTRFGDSIPVIRVASDLRRIIGDVAAEIATSHPASVVQIETTGDLQGEWDPERLKQALINLLANAIQHGNDTSPIKLSARSGTENVVIAVHNEGPPIPQRQLAGLFEAMKPSQRDATRDRRHLGLGLYIVNRIIAAHGGAIGVESTAEGGTTFTVSLPRQHATALEPARA